MFNIHIVGRIKKIKKTKKNIFLLIENYKIYQIVVKPNFYNIIENIRVGDIVAFDVTIDENNTSKYCCKYDSYILLSAKIISCCNYNNKNIIKEENLKKYNDAKHNLRNYLYDKGYLEVNVPILTDGETSSKADSFVTHYSKTNKKLFLRKTMDTFLRILSCNNINKIYSIGHCFRNGYVTSKNQPEFEMLSIFTNYITFDEAIQLSIDILKIILNNEINISIIDDIEYAKLDNKKGTYIIKNFTNQVNSYAQEKNGVTTEFKIKMDGITIVHGVQELESFDEYTKKINEQGKKDYYGELVELENALKSGAPLCFNLGISIVRILSIYNKIKINEFEIFPFSRLNLKKGCEDDE